MSPNPPLATNRRSKCRGTNKKWDGRGYFSLPKLVLMFVISPLKGVFIDIECKSKCQAFEIGRNRRAMPLIIANVDISLEHLALVRKRCRLESFLVWESTTFICNASHPRNLSMMAYSSLDATSVALAVHMANDVSPISIQVIHRLARLLESWLGRRCSNAYIALSNRDNFDYSVHINFMWLKAALCPQCLTRSGLWAWYPNCWPMFLASHTSEFFFRR